MVLNTFNHTLSDPHLPRHLLTGNSTKLEGAVQAGNEFLRIPIKPTRATVQMVEESEEVKEESQMNQTKETSINDVLSAI